MSRQTLNLTPEVYEYLLSHSLRETPLLEELRQETLNQAMSEAQISPEQGQFMALLVKLINAKNILEIGTYTGYSALVMALELPEDGEIITCDVSEEWTDVAKSYWQKAGVMDKITLKLAPALETLEQLISHNKTNTFDIAFIDADKANYSDYYDYCYQLVRPGGLILIDNVLWSGKVADSNIDNTSTNAIRALNNKVLNDPNVTISMLPLGDGITLAIKN